MHSERIILVWKIDGPLSFHSSLQPSQANNKYRYEEYYSIKILRMNSWWTDHRFSVRWFLNPNVLLIYFDTSSGEWRKSTMKPNTRMKLGWFFSFGIPQNYLGSFLLYKKRKRTRSTQLRSLSTEKGNFRPKTFAAAYIESIRS